MTFESTKSYHGKEQFNQIERLIYNADSSGSNKAPVVDMSFRFIRKVWRKNSSRLVEFAHEYIILV